MRIYIYFFYFVAISNAFALMFSPLKSSAFFLRDAKCPDVDLENQLSTTESESLNTGNT